MSQDELADMKQDALDYLHSLDQMAEIESELVDEYNKGDYSDFADDQADITGTRNDMNHEAGIMADDVDDNADMEDPGGSDYELAKYIIDYCDKHTTDDEY